MRWIFRITIMNLKKRFTRTILTILGIMIGIFSVVTLVGIARGTTKLILGEEFSQNAIRQIIVSSNSATNLKKMVTDVNLKKIADIAEIESVYPTQEMGFDIEYGDYAGYFNILGIPRSEIEKINIDKFSVEDLSNSKIELILGDKFGTMLGSVKNYDETYSSIYGYDNSEFAGKKLDAIIYADNSDEPIKLKFKVAGVINTNKETYTEHSFNVYCDIEQLMKFIKSNNMQQKNIDGEPFSKWVYSSAVVMVKDVDKIEYVEKKIKDMGLRTYNSKKEIMTAKKITNILKIMFVGIGAIALLVAVIGISNTMTTSVYDRVNEIGILKVLGCDLDELKFMYLFEAGILGLVGGIAGALFSIGVAKIINKVAIKIFKLSVGTLIVEIDIKLILIAIVLSIVLSVVAGFFPARWASKINPIDAVKKLG